MKKILIYIFITISILLTGCSSTVSNNKTSTPSTSKPVVNEAEKEEVTKINLQNFNQIQCGMDYSEVNTILGHGVKESETKDPNLNISAESYRWQNKDGSNIGILFMDSKVYSKAQFGLKNGEKTDTSKALGINNKEGNAENLPAEINIDNIIVRINKVVNDKNSCRIYITYLNNSGVKADIFESYDRIVLDGIVKFVDSSFNNKKHFDNVDMAKAPYTLEANTKADSVICFPQQQNISKVDIIIQVKANEYKFNNVKVDSK